MKRILFAFLISVAGIMAVSAQQGADNRQQLRIVDTLTRQEKANRMPVLLKSELDSLVALHMASLPKEPVQQPVIEQADTGSWPWIAGAAGLIALLALVLLGATQRRSGLILEELRDEVKSLRAQMNQAATTTAKEVSGRKKSAAAVEAEVKELREELKKIAKENEGLETMLEQYRHVKQEYEGLKQQMLDAYKVRFYPGFEQESSESDVLKQLVRTERSVAYYAYEKFLRPLIQLTDANKNHPAKASEEDAKRMADYLLSLGLLYSEYLYLRIADLSVGGKMVERVGSLQRMNGIDKSLLRELNLEHGSRALVLRMALDKMGIGQLSYPVFDETNLNLS